MIKLTLIILKMAVINIYKILKGLKSTVTFFTMFNKYFMKKVIWYDILEIESFL